MNAAQTTDAGDRVINSVRQLERHLAAALPGFAGPLEVAPLAGGRSNPTYRLDTPSQSYVLRRQPDGELLPSAHRMDREYKIQAELARCGLPVPTPRLLDIDGDPIGVGYYVMDFLAGEVIEDPALPGLTCEARGLRYREAVDCLAQLHSIDPEAAGLGDFGRPAGYYPRQLRRWASQYEALGLAGLESTGALLAAMRQCLPGQERLGIVHGDYRMGNLMFGPKGAITGVLDWELSTLGDPTADLAYFCLAYHLAPDGRPLPGLSGLSLVDLGIPPETEIARRYYDAVGLDQPSDWNRHLAFAAFRLAVITLGVFVRQAERSGGAVSSTQRNMVERFAASGLALL